MSGFVFVVRGRGRTMGMEKNLFEYSDILNSPIEVFYRKGDKYAKPVEAHWHYFVEIIYILEGEITATCNENVYTLKQGDMLFLPPQVVHSVSCEQDFWYLCMKFNINRIQLVGNYLPNLNATLRKVGKRENPPVVFCNENFKGIDLKVFFLALKEEADRRCYGYNAYIYSQLSGLVLHILRIWFYKGISFENDSITEAEEFSIQDALLYIDQYSNENINVAELAAKCNMSYSHFAKLFHKQYGQSCKQYIEFIRLNKAENLLLFTDYDLTRIAGEIGFSDCSHLIRSFKKRYHVTPKQFRQNHRLLQEN